VFLHKHEIDKEDLIESPFDGLDEDSKQWLFTPVDHNDHLAHNIVDDTPSKFTDGEVILSSIQIYEEECCFFI